MNNFSLGNLYSLTLVFTWQVKYNIITAREKHPSEYTGQEVERMDEEMTNVELRVLLEMLAQLVESKATTIQEAVEIIRQFKPE